MSINDFQFDAADALDEIRYNIRISNPSASRNTSNSFLASVDSPVKPEIQFGGQHTSVNTLPKPTAHSTPHRAWEAGYQSPFARTIDYPIQPFPIPPSDLQSSPLPVGISALKHHQGVPQRTGSYRPRIRKIVTQEISLDDIDISAMVSLGLPPFMVGQDMIANQNRFVRNECSSARQLLRLQRATADVDARHSHTERNIYDHLEQHKAALNNIANGSAPATWAPNITGTHSARTDPDFLALEKAHQETCARLEALSQQSAESVRSMQGALINLAQRLDQIICRVDYLTRPEAVSGLPASTTPLSPLLLSTNITNSKRKRAASEDSILASPSTMAPSTPDFLDHHCSQII
ncbi:hypothetical protein D9619_010559 [Psilocybe cf. subviscida]|uniref:Uncharacterized protein n=1 Tax=Psilocybe cf. subviscida TaxID=2480587 RepID=A0A8H5ES78_9AGAR|nr:hypothetical protein D9619_010559 [Psilocybe cf. subviscida]